MKKVLSLAIALVLLVSLLSACAGTAKNEETSANPAETTQTTQSGGSEASAEGGENASADSEETTSLVSVYSTLSDDALYLKNDDLPEVQANKEYTIGIAMTTVSTDWFKSLADEVQNQVESAGCKALVSICEDDVATQVSQLENFIAQKVDAVILGPCNPQDALTPVLKDLAEAGIPVITVNDTVAADAPILCAVSVDAYALGYGVGSYLGSQLLEKYPDAEEIQWALIGGKDGDSIAHNRNEGAKAGMADVDVDGKFNLVSFLYSGGYSEENGLETGQNMLTANPDLKCIIGTCDAHVIGASQAMTVLGMDSADVIMGAVDGSKTAMESISNGGHIVCTGMNDTHAFGVLATRLIVAYLNDGTLPASKNVIQDPTVCTIDNLSDYYNG